MVRSAPLLSVVWVATSAEAPGLPQSALPGVESIVVLSSPTPVAFQAAEGMRVVQMGPASMATAMNRGVRAARGRYVLALHPGDRLAAHALPMLATAFSDEPDLVGFPVDTPQPALGALANSGLFPSAPGEDARRKICAAFWQLPTTAWRAVLCRNFLTVSHLHFPHSEPVTGFFAERAALMLARRVAFLDTPLVRVVEAEDSTRDDGARQRQSLIALVALIPHCADFSDTWMRQVMTAALARDTLETLGRGADSGARQAALSEVFHGLEPRLRNHLRREIWTLPETLSEAMALLRVCFGPLIAGPDQA